MHSIEPHYKHKMNVSQLLRLKDQEFQELNQQFMAYQEQTKLIIDDLQSHNSQLRTKNQELQTQLDNLKVKNAMMQQRRKEQVNALQRELEMCKRENKGLLQKNEKYQREVVDLENNTEGLENELRAVNALLEEYESKVEKTMEELACLRCQLEECKETNQEQITRLKSQIQDTEEELNVVKKKHQKHHDESELRMSQFSWSSMPKDRKWKDCLNLTTFNDHSFANMKKKPAESLDSKQNGGFEHTLELMNSLLIELDKKCLKMKYNSTKDIM